MNCTNWGEKLLPGAKFCGSCGNTVSASENPASPQPTPTENTPKTSKRKSCLATGLVILVLLFLIGKCAGTTPNPNENGNGLTSEQTGQPVEEQTAQEKAPPPSPPPSTPPLAVTAGELFNAYQANEAAAQQQFGGRRLAVTGTITGIDLDFLDRPVVMLATSNEFMSAQAQLTEEAQAKASQLSKGQTIVLTCHEISEVGGTPMLERCSF